MGSHFRRFYPSYYGILKCQWLLVNIKESQRVELIINIFENYAENKLRMRNQMCIDNNEQLN